MWMAELAAAWDLGGADRAVGGLVLLGDQIAVLIGRQGEQGDDNQHGEQDHAGALIRRATARRTNEHRRLLVAECITHKHLRTVLLSSGGPARGGLGLGRAIRRQYGNHVCISPAGILFTPQALAGTGDVDRDLNRHRRP